jgi:hypothetical protein
MARIVHETAVTVPPSPAWLAEAQAIVRELEPAFGLPSA